MRRQDFARRYGRLVIQAICAAGIAGVVASTSGGAVHARQVRTKPSLTRIDNLSTAQIATLQSSGIRSVAALAAASPVALTRALGIELAAATRLVEHAKGETARLRLVYSGARAKFPFSAVPGRSATPTPEEVYTQLIAPTNECTILVRKVCGLQNQCASAPGCPVTKQLLDYYNKETNKTATAESCVISLQDGIVFPQCTTP